MTPAKKQALIPPKEHVTALRNIYASVADWLVERLSDLNPLTFTPATHGKLLDDVQEKVLLLNMQVKMWAPPAIKAAYESSSGIAQNKLELIGAEQKRRFDWAKRQERSVGALVRMTVRDLLKANSTIERNVTAFLGAMARLAAEIPRRLQTQEFVFRPWLIHVRDIIYLAMPANIARAHVAQETVALRVKAMLKRHLQVRDFIQINGRNYSLDSYSELVSRTRMREAQTQAVKDMCARFSNDLVEIPGHDNPCEFCRPHQNKVYSLSGTHPKYPPLPGGGPPWHPQCEDVMNPTSENALKWRKTWL